MKNPDHKNGIIGYPVERLSGDPYSDLVSTKTSENEDGQLIKTCETVYDLSEPPIAFCEMKCQLEAFCVMRPSIV